MIVTLKTGEKFSVRKPITFLKGGAKGKRWFLVLTKRNKVSQVRVKDVLEIKGGVMRKTGT